MAPRIPRKKKRVMAKSITSFYTREKDKLLSQVDDIQNLLGCRSRSQVIGLAVALMHRSTAKWREELLED